MNKLVVTNVWKEQEVELVKLLNDRFSPNFRIITPMNIEFGNVWKVSDSSKKTVEWTKRFLRKFIEEKSFDILLKIDPDIVVKNVPEMPDGYDVAGDFRRSSVGWVWFGGCQYYTRNAVEKLLNDPCYIGQSNFQDVEISKSIQRLNLKAYNMDEVDMWGDEGSTAQMFHPRRTPMKRLPSGPIILTH
jgi:hypothetical protein